MIKLLVFFSMVSFCYAAEKIPDFVKVCHRSDPNLLQCFTEAGEQLKPYLIEGNAEYGIPSVEPLLIGDLLNQSSTGLLIETTDVKTWGSSSFIPKHVNFDYDKQIYEIDVLLPMLRVEAHYNMDGKVLLLPMHGNGPVSINITNVLAKSVFQGELFQGDDGEPHLKFIGLTVVLDVEGGQIRLENLFNGDKVLNTVINDTVNKNFNLFLNELKPRIINALTPAFLNIANKVVTRFNYNDLFPQ